MGLPLSSKVKLVLSNDASAGFFRKKPPNDVVTPVAWKLWTLISCDVITPTTLALSTVKVLSQSISCVTLSVPSIITVVLPAPTDKVGLNGLLA